MRSGASRDAFPSGEGEGVKEFPWNFTSAAPPVQSLRDSAAATSVGGAAWRRRFRNDDGGGILLRLDWEPLRERTLDHGRACERILPSVVSDIRRGDSRDGKRGRGG